jgi:hypothetical protein
MLPLLALSHDDAVATQLAVYFELMLLRLRAARCCLFTLRDLARSCALWMPFLQLGSAFGIRVFWLPCPLYVVQPSA